jgi:hypothetical protein
MACPVRDQKGSLKRNIQRFHHSSLSQKGGRETPAAKRLRLPSATFLVPKISFRDALASRALFRIFLFTELPAISHHRLHMRIHIPRRMTLHLLVGLKSRTAGALFCAAALLLSSRMCFSGDCRSNTQPVGTEETLAHAYQPPDGDILHRNRFTPPGTWPDNKTFPTVLMLPPDVFKIEHGDAGVPNEREASYDLTQAGFLVFQVDHRLAPPGMLTGQTSSGHAPEQTDDLKRQVMAALADRHCNGSIYLVGGSAGGTLVLWVMLDTADVADGSIGWNDTVRAHIKAVVGLSGPAKFCDWSNPGGLDCPTMENFDNAVCNYVGIPKTGDCHVTQGDCTALNPASPTWLVTQPAATSNPPPVRLYATVGDTVPYSQGLDMLNALKGQFGLSYDVKFYKMSYQGDGQPIHAYKYWHSENNADNNTDGGECVKQEVIEFFQAHP